MKRKRERQQRGENGESVNMAGVASSKQREKKAAGINEMAW